MKTGIEKSNINEYNQLGMEAYNAGNLEKAKSFFAVAMKNDPDFVDAQRNYAEVLLQLEDYENGVQTFVNILGKHGNDILTLIRLAQLYAEVGKNDDAVTLVEKTLEIDPRNVEAKSMLANLVQLQIGNKVADVENYGRNESAGNLVEKDSSGFDSVDVSSEENKNNGFGHKDEDIESLTSELVKTYDKKNSLFSNQNSTNVNTMVEKGNTDVVISKFSKNKFFERKARNLDYILLRGAVEEDGDCYVIDLDPCVHGWVFHVEKKYVEIKPSQTTVCLPDSEELPVFLISIKRGAPMIKLEFCVSDDLESFTHRDREIQ